MDWQPIATVPRDGTKITGGWFAWDDARSPPEHVERNLKWDRGAHGLRRTGEWGIFTPTHWQRET